MALDKDILAAAQTEQPEATGGGLDPDIISAATPVAAQQPAAEQQPAAQAAPPSKLEKFEKGALNVLSQEPGALPIAQLLKTPAVRQFAEAAFKQGAAVPAESLARLVGFKNVPITPPDLSTLAGKAGALGGGALGFALTSMLGGEVAEAPALAGLLESLGVLGSAAKTAIPLAAQASYGAASSPDARLRGAAFATLGGAAGKAIGDLTPEAGGIRDYLLGGTAPKEIPQVTSGAVNSGYKTVKEASRRLYDKVQKIADKAGFKLNYNDLRSTGGAIQKVQDDFNLQPSTERTLDKLTDLITSPKGKTADYGEIHNQIMDLGEKSSSAYKPGTFEDSQALRTVKKALMDDVKNRAEAIGSPEITKALDDANTHYRLKVAPYHNRGVFGGIIKKTVPPDRIANTLTHSDNSPVLEDLSPKVKNLILHEKLKPAMKLTSEGKIEADPEKLWNTYSSLRAKNPALAERLITDETHNKILPLGKKIESTLRSIPGVGKAANILGKLPLAKGISKSPVARNVLQNLLLSGAVQAPALLEEGIQ